MLASRGVGLGELIEGAIHARRRRRLQALAGPLGDFYRAGGQELLLRGAPLGPDGLVLDVGGYRGEFSAEACWRFGARCLVVEPVPSFAEGLREKFAGNGRVRVLEAALGAAEGTLDLGLAADGTSAFKQGAKTVSARQVDAAALVEKERPIALLKLNIEGGEYEVLERLIGAGLLGAIPSVLVQFHDVAEDSKRRRDAIRAALAGSHGEVFSYPFVWERWDLRPAPPSGQGRT